MKAFRKNGYLKKNAKTLDVTADANFDTETYLSSPTLYGGNEEIVLKGKKEEKSTKPGKDGKVVEAKKCVCTTFWSFTS
jgi:hypothetical protein